MIPNKPDFRYIWNLLVKSHRFRLIKKSAFAEYFVFYHNSNNSAGTCFSYGHIGKKRKRLVGTDFDKEGHVGYPNLSLFQQ